MTDNDLWQLEYLALVAKISSELSNHIGINDKTLGMAECFNFFFYLFSRIYNISLRL